MFANFMPKAKAFTRVAQKPPSSHVRTVSSHSDDSLAGGLNHEVRRQMWVPVMLHSMTFVAFAVLFIIFIIVIEVLYSVSNRKDGLSSSQEKYHYLWTYGPTAVLTIVAGFWGQVEYRTKQLAPWKSMSQEPKPGSQSLLLDYVSDWNVVVMFRALRQSVWVVPLAVLGTLLIKLVTVVSTGLFMLQSVYMEAVPTTLHTQASFNAAGYDGAKVDGTAAMVVAGAWWLDLSYPVGSTDKYAFQPFTSKSQLGSQAVVSGTVDMFSADLQCDVGTVTNWTQECTSQGCEDLQLNMTLSTPSCSKYPLSSFIRSTSCVGGYYADVFSATCADTAADEQLIFAAAHWSENLTEIQTLICSPTYNITQGSVSLLYGNQSVVSLHPSNSSTYRTIPDLRPAELGTGLVSTMAGAEDTLDTLTYVDDSTTEGRGYQYNFSDPNSTYPSGFYVVANLSSPHAMSDLLDASILERVSRPAFTAIAAQIARQYLLSSADADFKGTYSAHIQRVVVRELSARIMEAALAVLVVLTAMLWVWRPVRSTPRDPGTIAGLATILSRSPDVSHRLAGCRNAQDITAELADGKYHTRVTDYDGRTFSIEEQHATEGTRTRVSSGPMTWWQPMSVSLWWWAISIFLPLLIIAGLETAYQMSAQHDGLGTVDSSGYIRYTWVYLPALVMLIVRIFFDCIHFSAMLFQPYLELRRGGVTAPSSLMENHLSEVTIYSFITAIARQQWAICATAFTVLLAPVLTVAVSGLYSTQDVVNTSPASIARTDTFNYTITPHSSTDSDPGLGLTGALVVAVNMSYPAWTYDELVIPTLSEDSLTDKHGKVQDQSYLNSTTDDPTVLELSLPALRASLNCTALPSDVIYNVTLPDDFFPAWSIEMSLGENCQDGDGTVSMSVETDYPNQTQAVFGSFQYLSGFAFGECPSLLGFYGVFNGNSTSNLRGFTCNPQIDQVNATGTFTLPGLEIQSVTTDASSSQLFSTNITSNLYFTDFLPEATNQYNQAFDNVFSAMLNDEKTLSISDLTDMSHYDTVVNATQHLYRVLMAQSLNGNSRIPSTTNSTRYTGTIVNPNRVRLVQSAISTRIIEGCLLAMVISTVIAYYFMHTKEVIPVNPCSIAGAATLLAGSDMVKSDVLPPGSEWCSDKELLRRGYFNGLVFGLGWWDGPRFGIDIGKPEPYRD
ncbi:hypothetical protein BO94DRAFT_498710 [Aspergillus sclerotioniger CBS 115572]|uniref:Uncharacterized protein n=1 Tax=Aspergillus sclerotioniger CBS 115572 TaxID=1450535 RepID=A0A317VZE7_9EURO|nr:hypothetical protein BO94DRAFT_498710 [Aspergillus sclerotioniger CBS 115572]PWY77270.1 hypothetical protein BO94DRAFT_498710 [Aspergillus sclerotioniger CBS 115572]